MFFQDLSSAGLSVVKQGGNLKERQEIKEEGEAGRAKWSWDGVDGSSDSGMSEGMSQEGKTQGEGKQETLWEDKERLVM